MNNFIANGFTFEMPENWHDRSMITVVEAAESKAFASNVIVMRQEVPNGTSIEDYARQQLVATRQAISDLIVLDERQTSINNCPAVQRLQRFVANGQQLQQAQTYILAGEIVLVVTCTATLDDFAEVGHAFRRILDTFRLFDPTAANL